MSVAVAQQALRFKGEEPGFELEGSPGVTVHPLMTTDDGSKVDVFYLTIDEITRPPSDLRRIIEFIVVRTPTALVVVDDRVITLDVVHQRQDIHLLHFQFANKGFGRRDADSRLCVNGQRRFEYLVVA